MITWPHEATDWVDCLQAVYPVFADIATSIAEREALLSVCCSKGHLDTIRARLYERDARPENLRFCIAPSNDTWARDYGPIGTLVDGKPRLNDFKFNGWGGKFAAGHDSCISRRLAEQGAFGDTPMQQYDLVLEGGAIETDGRGTLLASRSSTITGTRNPGCDQQALERLLEECLGVTRFLWLEQGGVTGDDTDGHIDILARFADPSTIVYTTAPEDDADHVKLRAMENQLRHFRTARGEPYRLEPLPFAGVHLGSDGRRLPASYANFLVINGAVLLPVYGVPQDREAESVLQKLFPGRRILPIDCTPLIEQNGSLHCLTMHFPVQVPLHNGVEISAA